MVEWQFNGVRYSPDAGEFPDGTDPFMIQAVWSPWVVECIDFLDGKGTQRHWKYPGAYGDQPAVDIEIYRIIRGRWIEMMNERMKQESHR